MTFVALLADMIADRRASQNLQSSCTIQWLVYYMKSGAAWNSTISLVSALYCTYQMGTEERFWRGPTDWSSRCRIKPSRQGGRHRLQIWQCLCLLSVCFAYNLLYSLTITNRMYYQNQSMRAIHVRGAGVCSIIRRQMVTDGVMYARKLGAITKKKNNLHQPDTHVRQASFVSWKGFH